jgi:ribonuclease HI
MNLELLKELDRELAGRKYTFEWVKGHAGHDLNEAADERARAAATAYQQGVAARSGPGFAGAPVAAGQSRTAAGAGSAAAKAGSGLAAASTEPSPAVGASPFGQAPFEEPDLFSELEAEAFNEAEAAGAEPGPEAIVEALERELAGTEARGDIGRTGVLLHPDFMEIGSSGRVWTRDAMMMALEEDPGHHTELEILGADRIGTSAVLLTYRSYTRSGTVLRSSLWVQDGTKWRLRFHQGTPEA